MKKLFLGIAALGLLTLAVMVSPGAHASAAASAGFNIVTSPLPIKLSTQPGKTVTAELKVKNQGNQAEGIKVGLMKFGATGDNGQPDLFDITPKDTYASWVSFSPAQFTAQPGVWITVTMTIKVPPSAGLGYYMAVTFSRAAQPGESDATNLKGAAATLVLLDVKIPDEDRSLQLVDFTSDHKLYEYLPANFNIKLHNKGNIYLAPVGNIFIQRGGKTVSTIDFNDAGGSVLPNSNRLYNVPWNSGFPLYVERLVNDKPILDAHNKPKENLTWDFSKANNFRFGHYTAKLLIVYDNGTEDVPLEASLGFWVIPWKMLLVVLVFVLLVGYGVFSAIRSAGRKAKARVSSRSRKSKEPATPTEED